MSSGELTRTPLNVVTKVGNSVTLTCAGTELSWVEFITNPVSSVAKTVTSGFNIQNKSKYGLNTDPDGKYELIIKSPVLSDGGRYRCRDIWNEANHGDAEVIVFGKIYFQFYFHLHLAIANILPPDVSTSTQQELKADIDSAVVNIWPPNYRQIID